MSTTKCKKRICFLYMCIKNFEGDDPTFGPDFLLQLHPFFGMIQKSCLKFLCIIKKKIIKCFVFLWHPIYC